MLGLARVVVLALALALAAPTAAAIPGEPDDGPRCDRRPLLEWPVAVGQCGSLTTCLLRQGGHWGVYLAVLGFGVLPEKPLLYCLDA